MVLSPLSSIKTRMLKTYKRSSMYVGQLILPQHSFCASGFNSIKRARIVFSNTSTQSNTVHQSKVHVTHSSWAVEALHHLLNHHHLSMGAFEREYVRPVIDADSKNRSAMARVLVAGVGSTTPFVFLVREKSLRTGFILKGEHLEYLCCFRRLMNLGMLRCLSISNRNLLLDYMSFIVDFRLARIGQVPL